MNFFILNIPIEKFNSVVDDFISELTLEAFPLNSHYELNYLRLDNNRLSYSDMDFYYNNDDWLGNTSKEGKAIEFKDYEKLGLSCIISSVQLNLI